MAVDYFLPERFCQPGAQLGDTKNTAGRLEMTLAFTGLGLLYCYPLMLREWLRTYSSFHVYCYIVLVMFMRIFLPAFLLSLLLSRFAVSHLFVLFCPIRGTIPNFALEEAQGHFATRIHPSLKSVRVLPLWERRGNKTNLQSRRCCFVCVCVLCSVLRISSLRCMEYGCQNPAHCSHRNCLAKWLSLSV